MENSHISDITGSQYIPDRMTRREKVPFDNQAVVYRKPHTYNYVLRLRHDLKLFFVLYYWKFQHSLSLLSWI